MFNLFVIKESCRLRCSIHIQSVTQVYWAMIEGRVVIRISYGREDTYSWWCNSKFLTKKNGKNFSRFHLERKRNIEHHLKSIKHENVSQDNKKFIYICLSSINGHTLEILINTIFFNLERNKKKSFFVNCLLMKLMSRKAKFACKE